MAQNSDQNFSIQSTIQNLRAIDVHDKNIEAYFDTLEDYECWDPLFALLANKLENEATRQEGDFIRLARIHAKYLEDNEKVSQICMNLVDSFRINYQTFRDQILSVLIEDDEFRQEAIILESVRDVLRTKQERIDCTERLCLIYEKKKFDELALNRNYESLINLDENNQKALRYFKAMHTQNQSWVEVVGILQKLYKSSKHINDAFRIGQELAAVYLFQLDQPEEAIDVLQRYCKNSPLDTSSILYEAYYRQKNWRGCLDVLQNHLPKVEKGPGRAVIHLKIGELQELVGEIDGALNSFAKSNEDNPDMLESLENLIEIHIFNQNWPKVIKCLEAMKSVVSTNTLKGRLDEALLRIKGGMGAR